MRQLWTRASRRRPFLMLAAMSVITLAASSPIDSAVLGSHVTGHLTALPVAAPGSASTLAAAAQASGLATSETSAKVVARDRATGDMPDDRSGPQVHFLYVVPADGTDRQLDANGAMEQSINRIERWFEAQTRDQALRIDTYKGAPDITFVRMPHSDAQATSTNPWPLWVIGEDLVAAGTKKHPCTRR
jgi:nucleotide-binding universal stress UspA family protein